MLFYRQSFVLLAVLAVASLLGATPRVNAQSIDTATKIIAPPSPPEWQVVMDGSFAFGPDNTALYYGGLGANYRISDNVRIGVDDIGVSSTTLINGSRYGLWISPSVSYFTRLAGKLEGSVGLAIPVQWRFGADLGSDIGTMPYLHAALDLYFSDDWSVGLTERAGMVLSSAYIMSSHAIPQRAMPLTTGVSLKYSF